MKGIGVYALIQPSLADGEAPQRCACAQSGSPGLDGPLLQSSSQLPSFLRRCAAGLALPLPSNPFSEECIPFTSQQSRAQQPIPPWEAGPCARIGAPVPLLSRL